MTTEMEGLMLDTMKRLVTVLEKIERNAIVRHRAKTTNRKQYPCGTCKRFFSNPQARTIHQRMVHDMETVNAGFPRRQEDSL